MARREERGHIVFWARAHVSGGDQGWSSLKLGCSTTIGRFAPLLEPE